MNASRIGLGRMVDLGLEFIAPGLSTLASLLSITRSTIDFASKMKLSKEQALDEFEKTASQKERDALHSKGARQAIIAMMVIPSGLLRQLEDELQSAIDQQIAERKAAGSNTAKRNAADKKAAQLVCGTLLSVKAHNMNKLPKGQLQDLWKAYGCT